MDYGGRIKQIRMAKGIKACFIAEKLNLTAGGYSDIERGRRKLSLDKAKRIAEILGVDITEFFFETKLSVTHSGVNDQAATLERGLRERAG